MQMSETHGVNPSMGVCFWCEEETGEILLIGRLPNDAEAPKRAIKDYTPCEKCQEKWKAGVTILLARKDKPWYDGQPPITRDNTYPSGDWVVISNEVATNIFKEGCFGPVNFMDETAWNKLGFDKAIEEHCVHEQSKT